MTQQSHFDASQVIDNLGELGAAWADKILKGLQDAGEYILGEAVDIVPLDTSDLSNSGRAMVDEANFRCVISFNTPYAVEQHENMTYAHAPGRTAKYLEIPLMTSAPTVLQLIKARMEER